jgi:hypothetical protein
MTTSATPIAPMRVMWSANCQAVTPAKAGVKLKFPFKINSKNGFQLALE